MDPVRRIDEPALVPQEVAEEILESFYAIPAWIPLVRDDLEYEPPTRWDRIRWGIRDARAAVRRWMLWRLFPAEARELEEYENEVR